MAAINSSKCRPPLSPPHFFHRRLNSQAFGVCDGSISRPQPHNIPRVGLSQHQRDKVKSFIHIMWRLPPTKALSPCINIPSPLPCAVKTWHPPYHVTLIPSVVCKTHIAWHPEESVLIREYICEKFIEMISTYILQQSHGIRCFLDLEQRTRQAQLQ
jgi:hypothetical protein